MNCPICGAETTMKLCKNCEMKNESINNWYSTYKSIWNGKESKISLYLSQFMFEGAGFLALEKTSSLTQEIPAEEDILASDSKSGKNLLKKLENAAVYEQFSYCVTDIIDITQVSYKTKPSLLVQLRNIEGHFVNDVSIFLPSLPNMGDIVSSIKKVAEESKIISQQETEQTRLIKEKEDAEYFLKEYNTYIEKDNYKSCTIKLEDNVLEGLYIDRDKNLNFLRIDGINRITDLGFIGFDNINYIRKIPYTFKNEAIEKDGYFAGSFLEDSFNVRQALHDYLILYYPSMLPMDVPVLPDVEHTWKTAKDAIYINNMNLLINYFDTKLRVNFEMELPLSTLDFFTANLSEKMIMNVDIEGAAPIEEPTIVATIASPAKPEDALAAAEAAAKSAEEAARTALEQAEAAKEKALREAEEARKVAEEAAANAMKLAEEAKAKALHEAEEAKQKVEDAKEKARIEAEEEAKRRAEIEAQKAAEEARKVAEEEARKAAEEEARKAAEEEARKAAEEEARIAAEEEARKAAEEEARKAAEEAARKIAEEEARKAAEEAARKAAEEEARKAAEEAARKAAEEEARKVAEEEARKAAEEDKKRREEEARIRFEEEMAQLEAEVASTRESEALKKAEEIAKLEAAEQARIAAEEEAHKAAEEARAKAIEEERQRIEEEKRIAAEESARKAAEEEAARKAEEARIIAAEEEARIIAEEKAKKQAELEAKIQAEETARKAAEEEEVRKAAEEEAARKAAEEAAIVAAKEEARREAEEQAKLEAAEQAKQAETERLRKEEEQQRRREEIEQERLEAEEEARLRAEEAARHQTTSGFSSLSDNAEDAAREALAAAKAEKDALINEANEAAEEIRKSKLALKSNEEQAADAKKREEEVAAVAAAEKARGENVDAENSKFKLASEDNYKNYFTEEEEYLPSGDSITGTLVEDNGESLTEGYDDDSPLSSPELDTFEAKILKLKLMKDHGLISEEEFKESKKQLLSEL